MTDYLVERAARIRGRSKALSMSRSEMLRLCVSQLWGTNRGGNQVRALLRAKTEAFSVSVREIESLIPCISYSPLYERVSVEPEESTEEVHGWTACFYPQTKIQLRFAATEPRPGDEDLVEAWKAGPTSRKHAFGRNAGAYVAIPGPVAEAAARLNHEILDWKTRCKILGIDWGEVAHGVELV